MPEFLAIEKEILLSIKSGSLHFRVFASGRFGSTFVHDLYFAETGPAGLGICKKFSLMIEEKNPTSFVKNIDFSFPARISHGFWALIGFQMLHIENKPNFRVNPIGQGDEHART